MFVELRYDDLYQELVEKTLTQSGTFIEGLKKVGLSGLAKICFQTDIALESVGLKCRSSSWTLRGLAVQLSPEIYLPEGGNALYVFALPE